MVDGVCYCRITYEVIILLLWTNGGTAVRGVVEGGYHGSLIRGLAKIKCILR